MTLDPDLILNQMRHDHRSGEWICCVHPNFDRFTSRLTVYRDDERWAMVTEVGGYLNGALLYLCTTGNCLENTELYTRDDILHRSTSVVYLLKLEELERLQPIIGEAAVSGRVRWMDRRLGPVDSGGSSSALARALFESTPELFTSLEGERQVYLPPDLPQWAVIPEWHRLIEGATRKTLQSYPAFQQLAAAIASGDADRLPSAER